MEYYSAEKPNKLNFWIMQKLGFNQENIILS